MMLPQPFKSGSYKLMIPVVSEPLLHGGELVTVRVVAPVRSLVSALADLS